MGAPHLPACLPPLLAVPRHLLLLLLALVPAFFCSARLVIAALLLRPPAVSTSTSPPSSFSSSPSSRSSRASPVRSGTVVRGASGVGVRFPVSAFRRKGWVLSVGITHSTVATGNRVPSLQRIGFCPCCEVGVVVCLCFHCRTEDSVIVSCSNRSGV